MPQLLGMVFTVGLYGFELTMIYKFKQPTGSPRLYKNGLTELIGMMHTFQQEFVY